MTKQIFGSKNIGCAENIRKKLSKSTNLKIKMSVSGFSFWLHGWNRAYTLENVDTSVSETGFRYILKPYTLYFFIGIIGLCIEKRNGVWGMRRECDDEPILAKVITHNKHATDMDPDSPFGTYVFLDDNETTAYFREN